MKTAIERLSDFGIKPSVQRIAIVNYLLSHDNHPTAETIYLELINDIPTLSRTTVYNTLKLLADSGAITPVNFDDNTWRYDGDITPHAHFKCESCGCIHDLFYNNDYLSSISFTNAKNYTITHRELMLKGTCPMCNDKQ